MRGLLTKSPILHGARVFSRKLTRFFPNTWMCLIWLNIRLFYWILVLTTLLSMQAVMTCTLIHCTVIFWLDMASKLVGLLLVLFCQSWGSKHWSCFYLVIHGYMGCYFLILRYMKCCDAHRIVLQCQCY